MADPMDGTGWTRTYTVIWEGSQGTETQTNMGESVTSKGEDAWIVKSDLSASNGSSMSTLFLLAQVQPMEED